MASFIYETYVIRVFEKDKNTLYGYASNGPNEELEIVDYNDEGKLYDKYSDALEAALKISKDNPKYVFDIQPVFLDSDDMYELCR